MKAKICELCDGKASLYCVSDSAFLCSNCDSRVHGANFLVARHVRRTICCKCNEFDGNHFSGVGSRHLLPICRSCLPEFDDSDSNSSCTSSSSTCISSSINRPRPDKIICSSSLSGISVKDRNIVNMDVKAEAILVNWCRKLGLESKNTSITFALHAFSICLGEFTTVPFRVSLASSLWFSLKLNDGRFSVSGSTCQYLKKLEEISGVPAKVILVAEKKIRRVMKINGRKSFEVDLKEGWAECSD